VNQRRHGRCFYALTGSFVDEKLALSLNHPFREEGTRHSNTQQPPAVRGDANAIMKAYVPDESLVVFDVVPPRQHVGAKAYTKDWSDFLGTFKGALKFEIRDLAITADGNMGFGHSIQCVTGTDTKASRLISPFGSPTFTARSKALG
jgi:hypothetical protein